ncbi:U3 small nucleolar RNA-associated protein 6 homolog [Bradysia coprophila]|uniref:U3 small nucleolar RNA-associated protein 6 homolog n=1 Tax=Bradysia coprophila TaxID=38358 RepID=UPI00187DB4A2|nr:U3 small nucleolar RNA-associated protein 6 homolog [Bradysia coprophila]
MSERVEMRMEQSIREYEQMRITKLFENDEINTIIKKREQFEYKLARPHKEIVDYLDYIRYERSLLRLVNERNAKEHKLINFIGQRIKGLYNQSTHRFPNRKSLWDDYFVFITSTLSRADNAEVSAVLDNTILHHGHHVENWLKYIKWERAIRSNETKVRNLLMRALMKHPTSEDLHFEFLDIELANERELSETDVTGNVTLLYTNAIKSLRNDNSVPAERLLTFKAAVLDLLEKFPFTRDLQLMVLKDVHDEHIKEELFWHFLAQRELRGQLTLDEAQNQLLDQKVDAEGKSQKLNIKRCVKVYEGALSKINTEKMWSYYLNTVLELNENIKSLPILKRSVLGCALKAAFHAKKMSEPLCIHYIDILYATGAADSLILNIIDDSLTMYPMSVTLWESKMRFYIQAKDDQRIVQVFEKSRHKLGNDSPPIWGLYMKYLLTLDEKVNGTKKLKDLFDKITIQPHENFRFLKVDAMENVTVLFGMKETRKFFNNACKGFPCLEMYSKMVELESLQIVPDLNNWRKCLESASRNYGRNNIDVWLDLIKFELKQGDPKMASQIAERAIGTLESKLVDSFIFNRDALQLGIVSV